MRFLHGFVDREIEDAGHGGDFAADAFSRTEKDGCDEGAGVELGFAYKGAERWSGAGAAQAGGGVGHDIRL